MPGRHAAAAGPNFYRDLLTMIGGILVVAALVYLGLSALSNTNGQTTTSTASLAGGTTSPPSTTAARSTTTLRSTTTAAPTTTAVVLRPPEEIRVQVLNAIGVAGLAGEVSRDLAALGYQTLTPGNYQPTLAQSRVWFMSGFEGEAFVLASQFPDALVEEASPDLAVNADIVVVLGESYER
jgi:hypothetical protein